MVVTAKTRLREAGPMLLAVFRSRSEIKRLNFCKICERMERWPLCSVLILIYFHSSVSVFRTQLHWMTSLISLSSLLYFSIFPLHSIIHLVQVSDALYVVLDSGYLFSEWHTSVLTESPVLKWLIWQEQWSHVPGCFLTHKTSYKTDHFITVHWQLISNSFFLFHSQTLFSHA